MSLDRVTITGADDSIAPEELFALSERFPFVEWGILISQSNTGTPRYPSILWIESLQEEVRRRGAPIMLSLHMCGRVVRQLLLGHDDLPLTMRDEFQRIQLNFHAERTHCEPLSFYRALHNFSRRGKKQFIFQLDGALGNRHLRSILELEPTEGSKVDAVPLYDISGGAGILPARWPMAAPGAYMGYAGGLGPDNLAAQIQLIAKAAGEARFWIDMETRVRSDNDRQFDLSKVRICLRIAEAFMEGTL